MFRRCNLSALILYALCFVAPPAIASTTSEMYRTKAVLLLGDGKLDQAMMELEKAVKDDVNDLHARFYRGIVYSRLGKYKMAAQDLKAVMDADIPYQNLHFELGYAEFHLERLTPAKEELQAAINQKPDFAPAQYYMGVVLYQLKEYEACLVPLEIATNLDADFDAAASFMRGDALTNLGREGEAEAILAAAIDAHPDSIYTEYSRQALLRLKEDKSTNEGKDKKWSLDLIASASYDSNVGLFADDRALPAGIEEKSDWRSQLAADGRYRLWEREGQFFTAGFKFFQSNHLELDEFDVRNMTLIGDYRHKIEDGVTGVNFQYVTTLIGGDDYRNRIQFSPYLVWEHDKRRNSFIKLRFTDDMYQRDVDSLRDGNTYELQYRHYWKGRNRQHFYGGLLVKDDEADADMYSYNGYGVEGGIQYMWKDYTAVMDLVYQQREYKGSFDREDGYTKGDIRISKPLQPDLDLEGSVSLINNTSTEADYEYDRYVLNLVMRWQL